MKIPKFSLHAAQPRVQTLRVVFGVARPPAAWLVCGVLPKTEKNVIEQKLERSCKAVTQREQHDRRFLQRSKRKWRETRPSRLLYATLASNWE